MTTLAQPRRTPRATRTAPRAVPRPTPRSRSGGLPGGILWIVCVGAFLAGVVEIGVGGLQKNLELASLGRERTTLRSEIATARAQLSSATANDRIASGAAGTLGLVAAEPESTQYVSLQP